MRKPSGEYGKKDGIHARTFWTASRIGFVVSWRPKQYACNGQRWCRLSHRVKSDFVMMLMTKCEHEIVHVIRHVNSKWPFFNQHSHRPWCFFFYLFLTRLFTKTNNNNMILYFNEPFVWHLWTNFWGVFIKTHLQLSFTNNYDDIQVYMYTYGKSFAINTNVAVSISASNFPPRAHSINVCSHFRL